MSLKVENDPHTGTVPLKDAQAFVDDGREENTRLREQAEKVLAEHNGDYDQARDSLNMRDTKDQALGEMLSVMERQEARKADELINDLNNTGTETTSSESPREEDPDVLTKEQMDAIADVSRDDSAEGPDSDAERAQKILDDIQSKDRPEETVTH